MSGTSHLRAAALMAGLLLASPASAWKIVADGQPYAHAGTGYSIQYPAGWRFRKEAFGDETIATRDGPLLQVIYVDFRKHKQAFRAQRKDATADMLPQELAGKFIAEATAARGLQNMAVLSDEPATLAGQPAFRLHLAYRTAVDAGSVRYEEILVGTNTPQGIFLVGYRGPVLHYFARDVAAFEQALATFAISPPAPRRR
ncbi:MAG: hypothetical protein FJ191_01640 [Gammaproteobacteria bacterium]|nr:hypothetical protein [Gammaproteobacteria bacterium]